MRSTSPRRGATLVEALTIFVLLAFFICLLLPAVHQSQSAARDVACQKNLKEILAGFESHHESKNGFPPARTTAQGNHGWCVDLLPFINQGDLYRSYKHDKSFYEPENQPVTKTRMPIFQCPEALAVRPEGLMDLGMGETTYGTQGYSGDYFVNHILNREGLQGSRGGPALNTSNDLQNRTAIVDGLSYTTLLHEQAGRPENYIRGVKQPSDKPVTLKGWWGAWTSYQHFQLTGFQKDGITTGFECAVNCQNSQGIYSFHKGGTYAGFCDGSVRFLSESIPVEVVFALATRNGGEIVAAEDF